MSSSGRNQANLNQSKPVAGLLWGAMGDSITFGSSAGNFSYSYFPQACAMVGGLVARPDSFTAGIPGQRSDQMLARFGNFLGYGAQAMVLLAGTNDASQAVPLATYIANMTAMILQAKTAGVPTILVTVPPRGSATAAAIHTATAAENTWIRLYGPSLGCEIADVYSVLVDKTTGYLAAAYDSGDGTHPNELGHQLMAVEVAKAMKRVQNRAVPSFITAVTPTGNLIADPLNARATPTTTWFEWPGGTGTAPVYAMKADTSGVLAAGQWAEMDFDGTAAGGVRRLSTPALAGFAVGDTLAIVGQIQIEDVSGTWVPDVTSGVASCGPTVINQSGVTVPGMSSFSRCAGIKNASGFYDIGPFIYPFTVPAGTTAMNEWFSLVVPTGHHYKMRIGALGILDLNTLGINLGWGNAPIPYSA